METLIAIRILLLLLATFITHNTPAKELNLLTAEYPPYVGKQLRERGPVVEMVVEAFRLRGFRVNVFIVPWTSAVKNAAGSKFDGVFPAWHFSDRSTDFVYSNPFIPGELGFYSLSGQNRQYSDLSDLKGLTIGIVQGYRYPNVFATAGLRTIAVAKDEQNMVLLCQNNIDLALTDRLVGRHLVKNRYSECAKKIHWMQPTLTTTKHYLMISRKADNHMEKLDAFNQGLKTLETSGKLQQILLKHRFGLNNTIE